MAVQTSVLPLGGGATRLSNVYGGASAYRDRVIADGASNYWRLGESAGTTAVDEKGAANGTISGGVTLGAAGAVSDGNTAMTFDGVDDKIVTPAITLPLVSTVECWIKKSGHAQQRPMLTIGTGQAFTWYVGPTPGRSGVFDAANGNVTVTGLAFVDDGLWHHLAISLDAAVARFYLDGGLDRAIAFVRTVPETGVGGIGHDPAFGAGASAFWPGALDEVAIYPRALTAAEILAHYQLAAASLSIPPDLDRPFRQLLLTPDPANTAPILIGDASVGSGPAPGEGIAIAPVPLSYGAPSLTLGPFDSGPVKLSHVYASGAGALRILGVPY